MGKCSYTRYKWKCPEPTWRGSEKYCIFHDRSEEKDLELFKQKLKEKLDKKDYKFRGYCFPEEEDFSNWEFEEYADFNGAIFQKDANFKGAIFQKDAEFRQATFRNAYFSFATFQKNADFSFATFQKNAIFSGTTFQNANFSRATIERNLEFTPNQINKLNLRYAEFLFKGHITADLTETRFHRADLENVAFTDCTWPKKIYEEIHMKKERLTFKELETIYRNLKQSMQRHGDYSKAGDFYYREMEMKRKGSDSKKRRIWLELYNLLAGYGEKPGRTALSSIVTIFLFAFFYWGLNCLEYPRGNPEFLYGFYHAVYFSFVTFTTLGLGDIHPSNNLGMGLICCEAVIGAFLIALFVVVFARKMMR